MKRSVVAALLAAATCLLVVGVTTAVAASGTQNGTGHCNPADPLCGVNPLLTGPPPPFVTVPSNCPAFLSTDTWSLSFVDGSAVYHGTQNKNGDWGGFTAEGPAVLTSSDNAVQYTGHATVWGGGGQNSDPGADPTQQSENGFTLHFNGSGPAGTFSLHVDSHQTTNNAGALTANTTHVNVSCG
jgi:hypothetical protein